MKFAERLAAHITPEWNSQYIKYDVSKQAFKAFVFFKFTKSFFLKEMKEFLYHYEENAPIQDGKKVFQNFWFNLT